MGTDILKDQYNLLLENQKKRIKKLHDKRSLVNGKINSSSYDVDDDAPTTTNIEKEIDKLNEVDLDSSGDDLNLNTNKAPVKYSASNASSVVLSRNNSKLQTKHSANPVDREPNTLRESLTFADKIREMKDENGRLRKLLSEKEYEIKYLKKQLEEEKLAFAGGSVGSDVIATKIVDLSKKIRELTAELEGEKTRNKQLNKTNREMEFKLQQSENGSKQRSKGSYDNNDEDDEEDETQKLTRENKDLKEKLSQSSAKMMEYKSQSEIIKQDLKKYHRALEKEVGDNVDIKAILNGQSNWRGRQQQISALQHKLADLKQQLGMMDTRNYDMIEEEYESQFMRTGDIASGIASGVSSGIKSEQMSLMSFSTTTKRSALDARNREDIKKIEKDKKEQVEKVKREYEALEGDFNTVKSKADAMKARNTVLTNEVKTNREQVKTLLEKGKHDDELIEALLQKQNQMKALIDDLTTKNEALNKELDGKTKEAQVKSMQDKNMIEQLRGIISEREKKVKQLEDEIQMSHLREQSNTQLQFILHGNSGGNNGVTANHDDVMLHDDHEKISSNLSSRNNSRNEFTSTRLASASTTNVNSANKNNSRLSGREIAATRHAIKGTKLNSRPNSATSTANGQTITFKKEHEELKLEYHELVTLNRSTEIERTRLLELVKTLQKRLESFNEKFVDSDNKYNEQRRRCVNLEKQLEKSKLESSNTGNSNKHKQMSTASATLDQYKLEELETSLLIQKDENDALKAALKSTLDAKEEDLRLYVEMLESTKRVFLDGLKEFKQLTGK